jgi:GntR family transcriptional regulator
MIDKFPPFHLRSDAALHDQLKDWILKGIHNGFWKDHSPLPSERLLSEKLELSRATVRLAMSELEHEGWLEKHHGRGTFVAPHKLEQPLVWVSSFTENMQRAGVQPSSRLLSRKLLKVSGNVARMLKLKPASNVAVITRVRLADGVPIIVERSHINYALTPGLLEQNLTESLYDILRKVYRLKLHSGEETLEILKAEDWVAKALGIARDEPLLYTERVVTDPKGLPIEFAQRYSRADQCKFRVRLLGAGTDFALKDTK